jgi:hypothetical protein
VVGPNERLRAARERTRSGEVPGECMSRREVAQAVNGYLHRTTGKVYDFDAHHLAKLERGVHRWPMAPYRAALRQVLGAATDAELGFYPPRRRAGRSRSPSPPPEGDRDRLAGAGVTRRAPALAATSPGQRRPGGLAACRTVRPGPGESAPGTSPAVRTVPRPDT